MPLDCEGRLPPPGLLGDSPDTTCEFARIDGSAPPTSSFLKQMSVTPSTPRAMPQVQAPQEGSAWHWAQHSEALGTPASLEVYAWLAKSTPISILPQLFVTSVAAASS